MNQNTPIISTMRQNCLQHNHTTHAKHVAVVIRNNIAISDYKFNHLRQNMLGLPTVTAHAEIAAIYELFRQCCTHAGLTPCDSGIIGHLLVRARGIKEEQRRVLCGY